MKPAAAMATRTERNRVWVLVTIPKAISSYKMIMEGMAPKYNVIHWEEFSKAVDQYAPKINAMLANTYGMPDLSQERLEQMPNLRALITMSTGIDHLDLQLLRKNNIKVYHGQGVNSDAVADMAFNLLLSSARRNTEILALAQRFAAESASDVAQMQHVLGQDVTGSTLGIVGLGGIGYEVARRATGFKMKILYYSRSRRTASREDEVKATYCPSIDALLPQVDFLVLSLPLTEETRYMMGKEQFQIMKTNAIIINVARGELINHDDLTDALRNGDIAGAALDVTEPEPLPSGHPLLNMPNVIVTPHIGAFTLGLASRVTRQALVNLENALDS